MRVHSIRSKRLVVGGQVQAGVVAWERETITAIEGPDAPADLDVGELVVMPGIVDTHVHINEPGRTAWEGFQTATRAAAAGGVTTVLDMPLNCIPVTTTAAALDEKRHATEGKLSVDVGFWGGVVPHHLPELSKLCESGIWGAKAFLCDSGIDEFPASDEPTLREAMKIIASHELPLLAHAELVTPVEQEEDASPRRYSSYLASRPAKWEVDAIDLLIRLSEETGCRVHIVHLSACEALPMLKQARVRGVKISVETCPHYLCLNAEAIADGATAYKCAPPIRDAKNRDALWQGLKDGTIDFVVTDHSPCTPDLKQFDSGNFLEAWGGIASLQFGLRTLWTEARKRDVPLAQFCAWLTTRPAAFAGLESKGELRVGADADIVVWDPDVSAVLKEHEVLFRHAVSPYLGQVVQGGVQSVYLRGENIFTKNAGLLAHRGQHLLRDNGSQA